MVEQKRRIRECERFLVDGVGFILVDGVDFILVDGAVFILVLS